MPVPEMRARKLPAEILRRPRRKTARTKAGPWAMPMKCFSLILGARNTPAAGRHFARVDEERIREITFRHFAEGFTILNAHGGWFDPQRKAFVEEDSRQILVCTARRAALRPWCDELARALGQKELLVVELGLARTHAVARQRRGQARPRRSRGRG